MKKTLKISRDLNKKKITVIGILFAINLFALSANNLFTEIEGEKTEELELKLEDWMLDAQLFHEKMGNTKFYFIVEEELSVEPWMLDTGLFSKNISTSKHTIERELELEDWMLDTKMFLKALN